MKKFFGAPCIISSFLFVVFFALALPAQINKSPRIYRDKVEAHWFADNQRFWCCNDLGAAAQNSQNLDITWVGAYGPSAGGKNAAAVLFHPGFYKVATVNCDCHDKRMDKASWNAQRMDYMPAEKIYGKSPDTWYAGCSNIENADKLQGISFWSAVKLTPTCRRSPRCGS